MTITQLIRALGGPQKVADMLDNAVTRQAIHAWQRRGVPPGQRQSLIALAAANKLPIPTELQK